MSMGEKYDLGGGKELRIWPDGAASIGEPFGEAYLDADEVLALLRALMGDAQKRWR